MPSDIAIKIRRGTNAQWIAANPILAAGELGLNTDNNRLKVGNGTLAWNSLSYINISPTDVNEATQDYIGGFLQNGTHDGIDVTYNDTLNTIALSVDRDTFIDKTTAQTITNKTLGPGSTLSANLSAATYKVTGLGSPTTDTDAATKLYVDTQISNILDAAPATLNTLNELAAAINDDASYAATITTALGNKQDKVSGVSDTEIGYLDGVTSGIQSQINTKAPINSPTFTGTVTFPANTSGANLTNIPNSGLTNSTITINGSVVPLGGTTTIAGELPSQTSQGGKYLTTDGSVLSWAVVDALPSQTGQSGKYLTTNGSLASWDTIPVTSQATSTTLGTVYGKTSTTLTDPLALGYNALVANTTGTNNTAVGAAALDANTTGAHNTALGANALGANISSSSNTAVGRNALTLNTSVSGSNTAVGDLAGSGVTSGAQNTLIGGNAATALATGSNNTVVGYNAAASSTSVSNEVTIGNASITRFRIPGLGIDINKNIEIMQIMEAY